MLKEAAQLLALRPEALGPGQQPIGCSAVAAPLTADSLVCSRLPTFERPFVFFHIDKTGGSTVQRLTCEHATAS